MSAEKSIEWYEDDRRCVLMVASILGRIHATRADLDKALESLGLLAMSKALRDQTVAKLAELKAERDTAHALLRSVRSALIGEVSFIPNSLTRDNLRRLIEELRHV